MEEQNEKSKNNFYLMNSTRPRLTRSIQSKLAFFNGKDINLTFPYADLEMLLSIKFSIIVKDTCLSPKRNESNICNKKSVSEYSFFI